MRGLFCTTALCVQVVSTQATYAQSDTNTGVFNDTIIVTAQKREENAQDVPITINAISGKAVDRLGLNNLGDAANLIPGLSIQTAFNSTNPTIFLRGVGFDDFNINTTPAIGIYLDEVYLGPPAAQLAQFYDIERIEVLKGPQGTLYGRNTTGGLISVVTRKPTDELSGNFSAEYGRFNAIDIEAGVGGSIIPGQINTRASASYASRDGLTTNRVTGDKVNAREQWSGRVTFDYVGGEEFEALLTVYGGQVNGDASTFQQQSVNPVAAEFSGVDGLCATQFLGTNNCVDALGYADTDGDPFAGDYDVQGAEEIDTLGATLKLNADFGFATLTSITAFIDAERFTEEDTDSSPANTLTGILESDQQQFSQELRLASNGNGSLRWIAGLYYLFDDLETRQSEFDAFRVLRPLFTTLDNPTGFSPENFVFRGTYPYVQTTDAYAAFAQAEYDLSDRLTVTGGLRYTYEKRSLDYRLIFENAIEIFRFVDDVEFDAISGRFSVDYQLSDAVLAYASYNRGFKSGGFNGGFVIDPVELTPFDAETLNAFEVGIKSRLPQGLGTANFAAFFYDYNDIQVFSVTNQGGLPVQQLTNAAGAEIFGAEAEILTSPIDGLEISLAAAYLDATYTEFQTETALGGADFTGNRMPGAPEFSLSALARYETAVAQAGNIGVQADVSYRTREFFESSNAHRLSQKPFALVGARAFYRPPGDVWEIAIWGKNIFDQYYLREAINVSDLGYDQLAIGDPATYGATLSASF